MKVYYDKDGNVIAIENNAFKWVCIMVAIMVASTYIGLGLMALGGVT